MMAIHCVHCGETEEDAARDGQSLDLDARGWCEFCRERERKEAEAAETDHIED